MDAPRASELRLHDARPLPERELQRARVVGRAPVHALPGAQRVENEGALNVGQGRGLGHGDALVQVVPEECDAARAVRARRSRDSTTSFAWWDSPFPDRDPSPGVSQASTMAFFFHHSLDVVHPPPSFSNPPFETNRLHASLGAALFISLLTFISIARHFAALDGTQGARAAPGGHQVARRRAIERVRPAPEQSVLVRRRRRLPHGH